MRKLLLGAIPFCLFLSWSCTTYKNVPYFTDLPQTGSEVINTVQFQEPIIQTDDILSINVKTIDPANNSTFDLGANPSVGISASGGVPGGSAFGTPTTVNQVTGYLVDKNGNIELPFTGSIHVAGMTRLVAKDTLEKRMQVFFKNPIIDVRFANFKITVLGEVLRPSAYTLPNEKVSIFDALGLAGDLTVYGKRENVVLLRDTGNGKVLVRMNLNSKEIIKSPYYFLKQNDIVYVEPSPAKAAALDATKTRTYALLASGLTVLVILVSRLNF